MRTLHLADIIAAFPLLIVGVALVFAAFSGLHYELLAAFIVTMLHLRP